MAYRTTYYIPWTAEWDEDCVHFEADVTLEIAVCVDRGGDVSDWTVVSIGSDGPRGEYVPVSTDERGVFAKIKATLQLDADGSLDARVTRAVDEDDHAPRPRSDAAEHGTLHHGSAL